MKNKREVLVKLFLSTLYLSAFTFGGGYVIITLMKKKFVDDYHWIEENEMLDLVAIAQSAPGPIAVNGAIVVGYKLAGLAGTLVAIIGTIIPPFVIISLISAFYHAFRDNYLVSQMLEGMQAGVGAVIASVTYEMGCGIIKKKDNVATIVMIAAFIAACVLGINVIYIVIDPGAGRKCASLAQHDGIYGSDHHFPDDSGTDCDQCSNLCWDEIDRNAGSDCGYTWIYHTILHYRDDHCKIVLKIPGNGHAAGNTWRDQTGGGRTDRIGGNFHFADSILGSFRENGDI